MHLPLDISITTIETQRNLNNKELYYANVFTNRVVFREFCVATCAFLLYII